MSVQTPSICARVLGNLSAPVPVVFPHQLILSWSAVNVHLAGSQGHCCALISCEGKRHTHTHIYIYIYVGTCEGLTNHGHCKEASIQHARNGPVQVVPGGGIVARPVGCPAARAHKCAARQHKRPALACTHQISSRNPLLISVTAEARKLAEAVTMLYLLPLLHKGDCAR